METISSQPGRLLAACHVGQFVGIFSLACAGANAWAQTAPITASGLNTHMSSPTSVGGQTQYDITGGTRPGSGPNLFPSFGEFNVPSNTVANFLNETGLPTDNILARVTGGQSSNIAGRDAVQPDLGGWLSSPALTASARQPRADQEGPRFGQATAASGALRPAPTPATHSSDRPNLSLWRLTPPGFLVRTFATDDATGCHT